MASILGGIRRRLNKTNQYLSEKIGRSKPTTFEEDFVAMEKRVGATEKLVDEIIHAVEKYLYPNPAARAKMRASAIVSRVIKRNRDASSAQALPEARVGDVMLARLDAFRDENSGSSDGFRAALERTGDAFKTLADLRHHFEDSVTQNFIKPLSATKKDIAEIHNLRHKLESRRLEHDCAKRKKGNGNAISEEELRIAEERFEQAKRLTRDAMRNFIERDVERVTALRALKDEMIDYHKQVGGVLQRLGLDPLTGRHYQTSSATPAHSVVSASKVDAWGDDGTSRPSKNVVIPAVSPPPPAPATTTYSYQPPRPEQQPETTNYQPVTGPAIYYRALYDCIPGSDEPGSLAFKEGEIIQMVEECDDDRNWFLGRLDGGKSGYVPYNYVELHSGVPR